MHGQRLTQKDCSQRKLGCLVHAHSPLVTKPRFKSAGVQFKLAKGQSFFTTTPVCFNVWKEYCWLSAVNSTAKSTKASAARA